MKGYKSFFKSSIDPEETTIGRPYGGVGFVCKLMPGLIFKNINLENDSLVLYKLLMMVRLFEHILILL